MHNLIALSLGLPGTPLHVLNDFDSAARWPTSPPPRTRRGSRQGPIAPAARRHCHRRRPDLV